MENTDRLLLKPSQAAELLSISERQLWSHTAPRGDIPSVRIGNCVRYSRTTLEQVIRKREQSSIAE